MTGVVNSVSSLASSRSRANPVFITFSSRLGGRVQGREQAPSLNCLLTLHFVLLPGLLRMYAQCNLPHREGGLLQASIGKPHSGMPAGAFETSALLEPSAEQTSLCPLGSRSGLVDSLQHRWRTHSSCLHE